MQQEAVDVQATTGCPGRQLVSRISLRKNGCLPHDSRIGCQPSIISGLFCKISRLVQSLLDFVASYLLCHLVDCRLEVVSGSGDNGALYSFGGESCSPSAHAYHNEVWRYSKSAIDEPISHTRTPHNEL